MSKTILTFRTENPLILCGIKDFMMRGAPEGSALVPHVVIPGDTFDITSEDLMRSTDMRVLVASYAKSPKGAFNQFKPDSPVTTMNFHTGQTIRVRNPDKHNMVEILEPGGSLDITVPFLCLDVCFL